MDGGNIWLSGPETMRFAFELSAIRIGPLDASERADDPFGTVQERLRPLLDLIEKFAPVHFATLWKVKRRGGVISAIARSKGYDPDPRELPYEYVCPIEGSHAGIILDEAMPIDNCDYDWLRVWDCPDIGALATDPYWNTRKLIGEAGLKRQVAIVMGGFCSDTRQGADYIVNLYIDEGRIPPGSAAPDFTTGEARLFIKSISNRLASGICALVEYRKNRITDRMISDRKWSGTSLENTLFHAMKGIVPDYIHANDAYLLLRGDSDSMRIVRQHHGSSPLPQSAVDTLAAWVTDQTDNLPAPPERSSYEDIYLVRDGDLDTIGDEALRAAFDGLLIARLLDRSDGDAPAGYVVVGNRRSDYAATRDPDHPIPDRFDWEDEQYLHHAASVLDFIIGMFGAEERKLRQAEVLGHEMLAPSRFIWETAERLKEDADGSYPYRFERMKLREIQDIMDSSEFLHLIAQSISGVGNTATSAPATRYKPEETDLAAVARDMVRVILPLCKRFGVDNKRITVASSLQDLHMDSGAVGRIFMNLLANAVKYSHHRQPDQFRVVIDSKYVPLSDLRSGKDGILLADYIGRAEKMGVVEGLLVRVEDHGIGVVGTDPQRVFEAGHRESGHISYAAMGAGLGLHVVRRIMDDHYGKVWLSRRAGPTEFSLFFPDLLFTGGYTKRDDWNGRGE